MLHKNSKACNISVLLVTFDNILLPNTSHMFDVYGFECSTVSSVFYSVLHNSLLGWKENFCVLK